jgi:predicted enzyme related to lactoylglutathione lyase
MNARQPGTWMLWPHAPLYLETAQERPVLHHPRQECTAMHSLVIFSKNKKRVSAFYQRTLGLATAESEPSHDLLTGAGVELVIHAIPRRYAVGITITRPPAVREDTPFKPAFVVADLEAVRAAALATGGKLKPAEAAWSIRGHTVLDGWDPEGNVVQFKQPVR